MAAIRDSARRFVMGMLLLLSVLPPPFTAPPSLAGPTPNDACHWWVYDAAQGEPSLYFSDPDATPPFALRLDAGFVTEADSTAQRGGIDFDGDGRTDPFRLRVREDDLLQWQSVFSESPTEWVDMAYDDAEYHEIRFGDFNEDSITDVFRALYRSEPRDYEWLYSSGGMESYIHLNDSAIFPADIGFGRFDDDLKTDIFVARQAGGVTYEYGYHPGGAGGIVGLGEGDLSATSMRYGDFDGNGLTDAFRADMVGVGEYQWRYIPEFFLPTVDLAQTAFALRDVQLGDFDGDGKSDPFVVVNLPDGRLEWRYWPGGFDPPVVLNVVDGPVPMLGEFVGDERTDALLLECGEEPVLTTRPVVEMPAMPNSFWSTYVGEVNGDERLDLIRVSLCQNPILGFCRDTDLIMRAMLGDGEGGFTSTTPEILAENYSVGTHTFARDVTGDGLTDIVFETQAVETRLRVAVAQGDGYFALGPQATFDIPTHFNSYMADVNGDERADMIWSSVCMAGNGFDFSGCSIGGENRVYTALGNENGTFTLAADDDYFGTGWGAYRGLVGDITGDGVNDLVFNSVCQAAQPDDFDCTAGRANYVYTAIADGDGSFTLSPLQTYGETGWGQEYGQYLLDVNGDDLQDLVWLDVCGVFFCDGGGPLAIRVGLANGDGTFSVGERQELGWGYWRGFRPHPADVNGDGNMDIALYYAGGNGLDSSLVHVLFSDGEGGFTRSPLQVLHGSGWLLLGSTSPLNGDFTGDGMEELAWMYSLNSGTDRLFVAGPAFEAASAPALFLPFVQGP